MTPVDTFTIDRNGREYTVNVYPDEGPSNPRDNYDHSATQFYVASTGWRGDVFVNELSGDAGNALSHFIDRYGAQESDAIERAYGKWRAITGSPVVLVTGSDSGYVQGHYHVWFALVDTDVLTRDYGNVTPEKVAESEADEYAAYAYGDVYGIVVSLNGDEIDDGALWGIVDRHGNYVRSTALEIVDTHERWLARESQKAGAGFVSVL